MKDKLKLHDLLISGLTGVPVVDAAPYFSWKLISLSSEARNIFQKAYRISVTCNGKTVWDSGVVESQCQSFIPYEGEKLISCREYKCSVSVWDCLNNFAEITGEFESGLLTQSDWKAKWIECSAPRQETVLSPFWNCKPPVLFSKEFSIDADVISARLYMSSHGIYKGSINGRPVGNARFSPEHTVYDKLQYYQTYDVGKLLEKGKNNLQICVADGWYLCPQTRQIIENFTENPGIIFQLNMVCTNGENLVAFSDGTEVSGLTNIVYSDIFLGEKRDDTANVSELWPVSTVNCSLDNLHAQPIPPVVDYAVLEGTWIVTPSGENVLDFGQVITGRLRAEINIPRGEIATFEFFETLDENGNYKNTMIAPQRDIFVSNGEKVEYEAQFTFHGFRYVRVTGCSRKNMTNIMAVSLSTEKKDLLQFHSSSEQLNKLISNIRWSQVNNTLSIPTDCPTREKAGFTGDIQLYAKTAMYFQDMDAFLSGYMRNLAAAQSENGAVPITVPETAPYRSLMEKDAEDFGDQYPVGVAGWSDAAVIIPCQMYQMTGNKLILEKQYQSMENWCSYVLNAMKKPSGNDSISPDIDCHLWNTGFHFGEWLIPSKETNTHREACENSAFYIAPIFGYISLKYMADISAVLRKEDKYHFYLDEAETVKKAIQTVLISGEEMITSNMGAYVLMIFFDLVPEKLTKKFGNKLVSLIEENDNCLDTGFLSTPYLLDALTKTGHMDTALMLLFQKKMPSWMYEVDHGATTVWESWNAIEPDGKVNVTSFDHYAFGCVGAWIVENILGIKPGTAGFSEVVIAPAKCDKVDWCKGSYDTVYGTVSVSYDSDILQVSIPCGMTAHICWKQQIWHVGSGKYMFDAKSMKEE